jgi:hypothetical protein
VRHRSTRSWLYFFARQLGNVNAVRRGTVGKRLVNIYLGRKLHSKGWLR